MSGPDIAVLLLYLGAVVAAGALVGGGARSTRDFFFGGQRFAWWLIAASCVATLVGSYSFMKYSEAGFVYGLASSSTYLNDWFWMPLWMCGWLPIIYYSRVESIPEYFVKRFGPGVRHIATGLILLYLLTGVSYNFFTLGVVGEQLFGIPLFLGAAGVGVVVGAYVTFGGQASVIMTDLVQGVFLLGVGIAIVVLAAMQVGGAGELWAAFPETHRSALPAFNTPPKYNFIGGFWNDAMVGGIAFYFFNQGMMLRFLSARSVDEGRKAVAAVILILMPLTAVAVASAGWVGQAMTHVMGPDGMPLIDPATDPKAIFTEVTRLLFTIPGSYGLVIAALIAALMSTVDTLINASAAIVVNDILRPLQPNASEEVYLRQARWASISVCAIGLVLVPAYNSFDSLYEANAFLKAAIPPPVAVAVLLGAFWKRSTTAGVTTAMVTAITLTSLSFGWPQIVEPFAHGTPWDPDGNPAKQLVYMRAFFSFSIAMVVGITVSLLTRPKTEEELNGLVATTLGDARDRFKGGKAREPSPAPQLVSLKVQDAELGFDDGGRPLALLGQDLLDQLDIQQGDLLFAEHPNPIWGGLRSGCFRVHPDSGGADTSGLLVDDPSSKLLGSTSGNTVKVWRWM
jgi:solute:Na+ symporter, SSS family